MHHPQQPPHDGNHCSSAYPTPSTSDDRPQPKVRRTVTELDDLHAMLLGVHQAHARPRLLFVVAVGPETSYVVPVRIDQGENPIWADIEAELNAAAAEINSVVLNVFVFAFSDKSLSVAEQIQPHEIKLPVSIIRADTSSFEIRLSLAPQEATAPTTTSSTTAVHEGGRPSGRTVG